MNTSLVYEALGPEDSEDEPEVKEEVQKVDVQPFVVELCQHLAPTETPSEAMRRLKKGDNNTSSGGKFSLRKKKITTPEKTLPPVPSSSSKRKRLTEWGYEDQPAAKRINGDSDKVEGADDGESKEAETDLKSKEAETDLKSKEAETDLKSKEAETDSPEDRFVSGLLDLDVKKDSPSEVPPLERITELCDSLLQQGLYDVYTTSREDFIASLTIAPEYVTETSENAVLAETADIETDGPLWQYKFPEVETVYGPFNSVAMLSWQTLFQGKNVQVRSFCYGSPEEIWREYESIDFALYV